MESLIDRQEKSTAFNNKDNKWSEVMNDTQAIKTIGLYILALAGTAVALAVFSVWLV